MIMVHHGESPDGLTQVSLAKVSMSQHKTFKTYSQPLRKIESWRRRRRRRRRKRTIREEGEEHEKEYTDKDYAHYSIVE